MFMLDFILFIFLASEILHQIFISDIAGNNLYSCSNNLQGIGIYTIVSKCNISFTSSGHCQCLWSCGELNYHHGDEQNL